MKRRRYHCSVLTLIAVALCLFALPVRAGQPASRPAVHVYVFGSKGCPVCMDLYAQCVRLDAELDARIVLHRFDTDEDSEYERLIAMEQRYEGQASDLPVVFVAEQMLSGEGVGEAFDALVRKLVQAGGAAALDIPKAGAGQVEVEASSPSPTSASRAAPNARALNACSNAPASGIPA
jgi:hypothetical protein